uniref:ROK family protein n=1 Tax=Prevotella sp. GTC17260 TaxID=3236796 RepID=A0AB33JBV4_9BACT
MSTIAIDLGGTNIRAARVTSGIISAQQSVECKADGTEQEVLDQIFGLVDAIIDETVERIGVGVPSVVDYQSGTVFDVQNIPSWREVHLKALMEARYHIPVSVDNDVNCYVLGEKHFGAAAAYDHFVGITLGTGVGAGIFIGGHLYRGHNTGAGEIGCLPYLDATYEQYCSSWLFRQMGLTGHELAQRAERGDTEAKQAWEGFGHHLGKLLQAILYTYDPQAIVIGGGIAASAPHFRCAMLASMRDGFPYPHVAERVKIHFSTLKSSNLLGASTL